MQGAVNSGDKYKRLLLRAIRSSQPLEVKDRKFAKTMEYDAGFPKYFFRNTHTHTRDTHTHYFQNWIMAYMSQSL